MTIRDMENTTGLTRANIRFYETQGLIAPIRKENNYREYAPEHAEILLRIKLLRALGMSLEQIKALQQGQENLTAALDRQIELLSKQREHLFQSQRVCREMRSDNVRYETLDARRYLNSLENPPKLITPVIEQDAVEPVIAPWQRFWARALDSFIYSCTLVCIATWLSGGKLPEWGTVMTTILGIAMTLVLEPVQLTLFGTTLGKWIFGIRVTDMDGRKLGLKDSFWRTVIVKWYGEALDVPFVNLWRLWKSYKAYVNNEFLPWDDPSELTVKDKKPLRYVAALAAAAAIFGIYLLLLIPAQMPEHQGDLTAAQFCENYRKLETAYDLGDERFLLQDDGTWQKETSPNSVYIDLSANPVPLDFSFTTENGIVTAVTISEELQGEQEGWIGSHSSQMQLSSLAFLMAQPEYNLIAGDEKAILTAIIEHPFTDFSTTVCGLEFRYDVELIGYWVSSGGFLVDDDDPETVPFYAMTFTITKTG